MSMVYRWKGFVQMPVSAQVAGEELDKIRAANSGILTKKLVVKEAKSKSSPLHSAFEWNDTVAAEKYREDQAGYMIRSIEVTMVGQENSKIPVRAFVSVASNEDKQYRSIAAVMVDQELREQVLDRAFIEFNAWKRRYENLLELAEIFTSASRIQRKLKRRG